MIDNASIDGSVYFVRKHYPDTKVIELSQNKGFAEAINIGAQAATNEYLFLLNNDAAPDPDCLSKLLEPIIAGECECSTAQIINEQRSLIHSFYERRFELLEAADIMLATQTLTLETGLSTRTRFFGSYRLWSPVNHELRMRSCRHS